MANHAYQVIVRSVRYVKRRWRTLLIAEGVVYTAAVVLGVSRASVSHISRTVFSKSFR